MGSGLELDRPGSLTSLEDSRAAVVPGYVPWIVTVAVRMPGTLLLLFIALGAACGYLTAPFFDFSEPLVGLRLRYDETAQKSDAWLMSVKRAQEVRAFDSERAPDVAVLQQSVPWNCMTLVYVAAGDDNTVFTRARLDAVSRLESAIYALPDFSSLCQKEPDSGRCVAMDSVLRQLPPLSQLESDASVSAAAAALWASPGDHNRFFQLRYDPVQHPLSNMTRSSFCFGLPLAGFRSPSDRGEEQKWLLWNWIDANLKPLMDRAREAKEAGLSLYYDQWRLTDKETKDILFADVMWVLGAVVVVWLTFVVHMRSLFLATLALVQVLLSFPLGFFVYRFVLGIQLFGGLQAVAIFIILGVGADDCFVYVDAFKQTLPLCRVPGWDLTARLSFAFKRARYTMFVTSLTTAFAFATLMTVSIPTVRFFGLFATLLVTLNFMLVTTMFTCVLVLWERYVRKLRPRLCRKSSYRERAATRAAARKLREQQQLDVDGGARAPENNKQQQEDSEEEEAHSQHSETSFEASSGARASVPQSPLQRLRSNASQMMSGLLEQVVEVEEDEPVDPTASAESVLRAPAPPCEIDVEEQGGLSTAPVGQSAPLRLSLERRSAQAPGQQQRRPWLARHVFGVPWRRNAVLVLFGGLFVASVVLATGLQPGESENPFWGEGHFFWTYNHLVPEAFKDGAMAPSKVLHVVHGLASPFQDRSGTREHVKEDLGRPIRSTRIDFGAPTTQQYLRDECYAVANSTRDLGLVRKSGWCYMAAFALWREARGEPFPVPRPAPRAPALAGVAAPAEAALVQDGFHDALAEFLSYPQFAPLANQIGMERRGGANASRAEQVFGFASFETRLQDEDALSERERVDGEWQAALRQATAELPEPAMGPREDVIYTDWDYFVMMRTQQIFLSNTFSNMAGSTALALGFLFLATVDVRLCLLAGVVIVGIVVNVLGLAVLIGWKLDTILSVAICLLVGFTSDYCLHLAVSYDEAFKEKGLRDRASRLDHVLTTMLSSIMSGAASTFLAAVMLFPCTVKFFVTFGQFLAVAIAVALVWAMICFPALLALCGPEQLAKSSSSGGGGLCSSRGLLALLPASVAEHLQRKHAGLYDLDAHKVRGARASQLASALALLLFALAGALVVVCYGSETRTLWWAPPAERGAGAASPTVWGSAEPLATPRQLERGRWHRLSPKGETGCARGDPFHFFFKPSARSGAPLVVELQGGTDCWNYETCRAELNRIRFNVDLTSRVLNDVVNGTRQLAGLADPAGPFADANHLLVPLCTGDMHLGNATTDYGRNVVVQHKGGVNALAALRYALEGLPEMNDPRSIVLTGTGAGAYGALTLSGPVGAFLEATQQDDRIRMLVHGDAGLGVFAPGWLETAAKVWGVESWRGQLVAQINGANVSVALTTLAPKGPVAALLNLTNNHDLALFGQCINGTGTSILDTLLSDRGTSRPAGESINTTDSVERCLALSRANATAGGPAWAQWLGALSLPAPPSGAQPWADWLRNNTVIDAQNATCFNTSELNATLPVFGGGGGDNTTTPTLSEAERAAGLDDTTRCFNVSVPGYVNGSLTDVLQAVPSMYLLSALRFRKHVYSQFSTAYDYRATQTAAEQYLGYSLPGVTFTEQQVFFNAHTQIYDAYRAFMPDNYHHLIDAGSSHGQLSEDRFYRAAGGALYQLLFGWQAGIDVSALPANLDCRRDAASCSFRVDVRNATRYF
jgi:hypothetical protein